MNLTQIINITAQKIQQNWGQEPPLPLKALSTLYGWAVSARYQFYKSLNPSLVSRPVIAFGNLSVGGTGKTPLSLTLAEMLLNHNYCPAVLSRGYGRNQGAPSPVIVSKGGGPLVSPLISGDEPWLMADTVNQLMVVVDNDRVRAAHLAIEQLGADVLILDDGFQQMRLKSDCSILLLPAENTFGNGHLLPAGPLREPISSHLRAHILITTGATAPTDKIIKMAAGRPVFAATYHPTFWRDHQSGRKDPFESLIDTKIFAFCGLARPQNFAKSLENFNVIKFN
ncbi:MAG: tetraacyldisaccharide 4'-kinase, partial [Candidatus Adiutrix sp.]